MPDKTKKDDNACLQIKEKYADPVLNLALDTIDKNKQAIIFANTKRSAEKTAEDISMKLNVDGVLKAELEELAETVLKSLSRPTRQCERLAKCIRKGAAFHHSGLTQKQKDLIQDEFRSGRIRIIAATPTLAAGIDLPAFRTILKDLKRFGSHGMQFIPVLEYLQMAGRAGRPKYDNYGEAIAVAKSEPEKQQLWDRYILGEPEEIYSKLAAEPALRFYLLSLIAGNFVSTKAQIMDFFSATFWAHQYQDMQKLEAIIDKMLMLLEEYEFIRGSSGSLSGLDCGFVSADEIGTDRYKPTPLGKRVAELYIDPLTAHEFIVGLRKAEKKHRDNMLLPFSFLQLVSYTIELRPLLRVKVREYEDMMEKFARYEEHIITEEPSNFDMDYDEFINSVKTALFFDDWTNEKTEDLLLDEYDIRPGEIRVKLDNADWLLYSAIELAKILQYRDVVRYMTMVRTRLKYGVREELLPLLKLKNIGRVRARKLFVNGYKDIGSIKRADLSSLKSLLGTKTAEDVKEQLGETVEKVKKNKRKGQKSVADY